jgi:hypothetical protein
VYSACFQDTLQVPLTQPRNSKNTISVQQGLSQKHPHTSLVNIPKISHVKIKNANVVGIMSQAKSLVAVSLKLMGYHSCREG